ncbi:AraC family transcriptional regulator ligand-binding domain-containing protein [Gallaecimonas kandeliae]|uniref:AraC family transcriptional regulator n=1 Tax=Gallaecimonas kandeliae TaxID=3029055 RepID=UPI0026476CD3|nr:AraC family transcriptional regulator [Gallaecimonas kandeliae]WKE67135.1 AraC family transcriptional regulator ligand-binding domain-containing protein [Gallaecimonas kandeliae]
MKGFWVQPGWRLMLADMGLESEVVLRQAGLPADLFSRPGASLGVAEYFRLWQTVEALAGPQAPLRLGQAISTESFAPPIFASLCSRDLNQALQRLQRYKPLICPMHLELEVGEQGTAISLHCDALGLPIPGGLGAAEMVFFTQLARLATRHRVEPLAVSLPQLPADLAPYHDYFGVLPVKGEVPSLLFSAQDARRPFLTHDSAMWDFFEPELKRRLAELSDSAGLVERLRALLLELLPSGSAQLEQAAKGLAISKRTLQRQLAEAGTHFQAELSHTRERLARHYLEASSLSLQEIAFLLGFADNTAFLRSFKQWTGLTASQYRASCR